MVQFLQGDQRRGFPRGGMRNATRRWRRFMRALRNRKAFGRTLQDRIKLIRTEIDVMSDREQIATLGELPAFFRSVARQSVAETAHTAPKRQTE